MIWNIVDKRKRQYRWREINAVISAHESQRSTFINFNYEGK